MTWPCDLCLNGECSDPLCRAGRQCRAWLCCGDGGERECDHDPAFHPVERALICQKCGFVFDTHCKE